MEEPRELAVIEKAEIVSFPQEDIDKKLVNVDKVFELLGKLRRFALKHLSPKSVTNEGGNPYITESGVNVFDSPFGIYEKEVSGIVVKENGSQLSLEDANAFTGDLISIIYRGVVGSKTLGIEFSFEGGTYFGDTEAGQKDRKFHDKEDFLFFAKKAKANWRGRARRKLLGLDNITWEELKEYGITTDNCTNISRKSSQSPQTPETLKSENEIRAKIQTMITEFVTDKTGQSDMLADLTKFTAKDGKEVAGVRNPNNLTGKRLEITLEKVTAWYNDLKKQWGTDAKS